MATYEWNCSYCGITTETTASYSEEVVAPLCCNQTMARFWSGIAISFKGSGFYSNDKGRK